MGWGIGVEEGGVEEWGGEEGGVEGWDGVEGYIPVITEESTEVKPGAECDEHNHWNSKEEPGAIADAWPIREQATNVQINITAFGEDSCSGN